MCESLEKLAKAIEEGGDNKAKDALRLKLTE